jgi:hypothetical protein
MIPSRAITTKMFSDDIATDGYKRPIGAFTAFDLRFMANASYPLIITGRGVP